jgi:hypothetical protein
MPKIRYSSSGRKTKAHGNLFFKKAALSLPTIFGGVISTDSAYRYHTFRSTAQLEVVGGTLNNAEILLVAGGGNQANGYTSGYSNPTGGAGGGAGGLINLSNISLTPGYYTALIGAGGFGNSEFFKASDGNPTVSGIAYGGGYGGQWYFYEPANGGSGGGGDWNNPGGLGVPGQGNNGGSGFRYYGTIQGGSGGGAGQTGGDYNSGRGGGNGLEFAEWAAGSFTGSQGYYAGGGGGSAYKQSGLGGGDFPNTGSGGTTDVHGPGSGLFILRYPKSAGNA